MTKLSSEARRVLADACITVRDWIAYSGWLKEYTDETGDRRWVPETEWRGDEYGCTDDRCIDYHHDVNEKCRCLPALIDERAKSHGTYDIWQNYRASVEANDARDDQDAYDCGLEPRRGLGASPLPASADVLPRRRGGKRTRHFGDLPAPGRRVDPGLRRSDPRGRRLPPAAVDRGHRHERPHRHELASWRRLSTSGLTRSAALIWRLTASAV